MHDQENGQLISIGFVLHNRGNRLLSEALDSLLAQTHTNFELIISDDTSSDETPKICEEYAKRDNRVKYFRQEKKPGGLGGYNFVRSKATGEYFMWACDDDIWDKIFLEKCLAVLKKDAEVIMAISDFVETDEHRNSIHKARPAEYFPFARELYARLKAFTLFYKENGPQLLFYGLWRREKVVDIPVYGKKDGTYWWGFPDHFIFRALTRGPFGFVDEILWSRVTVARLAPLKRRPWIVRIVLSLVGRIGKIIGTPVFWYNMQCVLETEKLSWLEKAKLVFWNLYVMARLFFVRKI